MVMKSLFLDDYRNLPGSDRKAQNSAQHQRQLPGVDTVLRSLRGHLRRRWVRRVQEHSALLGSHHSFLQVHTYSAYKSKQSVKRNKGGSRRERGKETGGEC